MPKILHVVDECTREALATDVERSIDADGVVRCPGLRLFRQRPRVHRHVRSRLVRVQRHRDGVHRPGSPWQRPTNENGNGLLRRYVGKGTDLSRFSSDDLRAIEHRINTMPRRSLHWSTAHDVYTAAVAMTG